ncbi:MAG: ribonuclease HI [Proteobacteria bacterium]|nr:ribonuclease HI [Pseudomonadota bacterium]NCA27675.1 ribonuclease HI [Pseudomonadota bacterium]
MTTNSPQTDSQKIIIYTDGACSGNPGDGGWGAILMFKEHQKQISGSQKDTTNNQMEIKAVIESLKVIKKSSEIIIYTDSKYVMDGITKWINGWKINGWKTADKKPVKNCELWRQLDIEVNKHSIEWRWIKGHSGNKYNEIADNLAREAIFKNI